ncbi:MAG: hypothetical protein SNF60_08065, partial [Rikenellaceae bacterium]
MTSNKPISVAFTGYRESKLLKSQSNKSFFGSLFGASDRAILNNIADKTYTAIEGLYEQGCLH